MYAIIVSYIDIPTYKRIYYIIAGYDGMNKDEIEILPTEFNTRQEAVKYATQKGLEITKAFSIRP